MSRRSVFVILALSVVAASAIAIARWSPMKPTDFADKTPVLRPEEYFAGKSRGQGVFFDRFGTIRTTFTVDLDGTWDGKVLSLVEELRYGEGPSSKRTFTITKQNDHLYSVEMPDLVGLGTIEVYGNCMRWSYRLNQDMGNGRIWTLTFDDWMFLQGDGVILNRAYASKWGIGLGEVFMSVSRK